MLAEPGAQNLQVSPGVVGSLLLSSEYATASYGLTLQYLEYFHEFLVTLSGCTIDDDDNTISHLVKFLHRDYVLSYNTIG